MISFIKTINLTNSNEVVLISDEDYLELLILGPWHLASYPLNTRTGKALHKIIAAKLNIKNPDHKDRNKLNAQRENLREATNNQQNANREKYGKYTSKYKGVSWFPKIKKWKATIKRRHLGYFNSEESAALAYNIEAIKEFGEFAVLNRL